MGMPRASRHLPPPQTREFADRIVALDDECRREVEQSIQSLQEIGLLLNKTNSEVEKLSSRELQLSNQVRDMEMHLDNYGREDIRDLYNLSHETQLRLFMMRSQAEQLQHRQEHIKEYQDKLYLLVDLLAIQPITNPTDEATTGLPRHTGALGFGDRTNMPSGPSVMNIIEAQEDERLRISRQIHDGPTQSLTNLVLRAEICERLIDRDVAEARSEIAGLKAMINNSLQDTRRMIFDLRPMILDDIGLIPTIRRYFTDIARVKGVQGDVTGPEYDLQLTTTMQVALFRFVQTVVGALLVDGSAEHLDVDIDHRDTECHLQIDASSVDSDRDLIEERLDDAHLQHRLTMLGATLTAKPLSNRGYSVEILVPIPAEAIAS